MHVSQPALRVGSTSPQPALRHNQPSEWSQAFSRSLICTGARRNPETWGTHQGNRKRMFDRTLRAGSTIQSKGGGPNSSIEIRNNSSRAREPHSRILYHLTVLHTQHPTVYRNRVDAGTRSIPITNLHSTVCADTVNHLRCFFFIYIYIYTYIYR